MLNIMKADLYRILKGKAIYITILVIILWAVISVVAMQAGTISAGVTTTSEEIDYELIEKLNNTNSISEYREIMKESGEFNLDSDIIAENGNLYYIFIVVVSIILVCDFSHKTIKNTLSDISRKKYYISKILLIYLLSTILIFFNVYFNHFLNLIVNGSGFTSSIGILTKQTIIQLPLMYGIISLLTCLSFVFKKGAIFNSISIPLIIVIQLLASVLMSILKVNADWFYNYEFQFALRNLVNNPTSIYILKCALLGLAYIIIFNIIGYYSFKKTEIK